MSSCRQHIKTIYYWAKKQWYKFNYQFRRIVIDHATNVEKVSILLLEILVVSHLVYAYI